MCDDNHTRQAADEHARDRRDFHNPDRGADFRRRDDFLDDPLLGGKVYYNVCILVVVTVCIIYIVSVRICCVVSITHIAIAITISIAIAISINMVGVIGVANVAISSIFVIVLFGLSFRDKAIKFFGKQVQACAKKLMGVLHGVRKSGRTRAYLLGKALESTSIISDRVFDRLRINHSICCFDYFLIYIQ